MVQDGTWEHEAECGDVKWSFRNTSNVHPFALSGAMGDIEHYGEGIFKLVSKTIKGGTENFV
jgi:hypothetical protein